MSGDARLGADPLSWLAPGAAGKTERHEAPRPSPTPAPASSPPDSPKPVTGKRARLFAPAPPASPSKPSKSEDSFKVELELPKDQLVAQLQDFLDALESGRILAQSGAESMRIPAGDRFTLKLKASGKKGEVKCSLSLKWEQKG